MSEEKNNKALKIERITRYEDLISKEEKRIKKSWFLYGLEVILGIYGISQLSVPNLELRHLILYALGELNMFFSIVEIKGLIEAISRKNVLEGKVEDIKFELGIEEDKTKGKTR